MSESLRVVATLLHTQERRVLQLDGLLTLSILHEVVQIVFGWQGGHARHPHRFSIGVDPSDDALAPEAEWSVTDAFGATEGELYYHEGSDAGRVLAITLDSSRASLDGEPVARLVRGEHRGDQLGSLDIASINDELARLDPAFVDPTEVARFLHPYLWFLRRLGTRGVAVTEAGWLQPDFVREVMDELGWTVRFPGQVRSEKRTPPVRMLKEHLRRLGLVRKYRGRLMPQVKTASIADDPARLWSYLAQAFPSVAGTAAEREAALLWAVEIARGGDVAGRDERVADALADLGWRVREGELPTAADAAELSESFRLAFADLGDPVAPWPLREPTPIARAFARAIVMAAA